MNSIAPESAPAVPEPESKRDQHIDALRGFALFGILVVNIMSFANGLNGPSLGVIDATSSLADQVVMLLVAFFAEYKFYPIFAFLFGYGFLIFWRRARRRGGNVDELYSRRLWFLGLLGVFHGLFIWFGDILSRYALTAIFLRKRLSWGPKKLLQSMRTWLLITLSIAMSFALMGLLDSGSPPGPTTASIYPTGSYVEATLQRIQDYLLITVYFCFLIPQVMLIFLAGVFTARMGWLHRPEKYRATWLMILKAGLVLGLPASAAWTAIQWQNTQSFNPMWAMWMPIIDLFLLMQSAAIIAAFMLTLHRPVMQRLVPLLAPAGRMPLTNYLAQSVICSVVLYGSGLGLGDDLRQAGLVALAVGIFAVQLVFSQWWMARHDTGPMEAWWRRHVYRR